MRVIYIHERLHIYSSVCTFIRFRGGENVQSPSGVLRRGATGVCGRAMQSCWLRWRFRRVCGRAMQSILRALLAWLAFQACVWARNAIYSPCHAGLR